MTAIVTVALDPVAFVHAPDLWHPRALEMARALLSGPPRRVEWQATYALDDAWSILPAADLAIMLDGRWPPKAPFYFRLVAIA